MRNHDIIESARKELITNKVIAETEELHTFAGWKSYGLSVKKGEKAIAKVSLWKRIKKKETTKGKDRYTGEIVEYEVEIEKWIKTTKCLFSSSQVEYRKETPAA